MAGLVSRTTDRIGDSRFDEIYYVVKDVTGRRTDPHPEAISMVSCHGDTAKSDDPDYVAIDEAGRPATRDRPYFDWGYVCPSHPEYRSELMALIDTCGETSGDVRLDDVGFAREEYCYCDRCTAAFASSAFEDRSVWRAHVITDFVEAASAKVPGSVYLTLYPDPMPGHLFRRAGLDLEALEAVVDAFVVPLYDLGYRTTYWLEVLASGFRDRLERPFTVELYAAENELEDLTHAARVVDTYADRIAFAYDDERAVAAVEALDRTD